MTLTAPLDGHGLLFDSSLLHSSPFAVLNAFVAINTVMFLALALAKLLPKVYVSDWFTSPNRRAESRGIYPEAPGSRPTGAPGGAAGPGDEQQPGPDIGRTSD